MKSYKRTDKLSDVIHRALAEILIEDIKDPRVDLVTVTGARVTRDMRHAVVFVTAHVDAERYDSVMEGLEAAKGRIRRLLGEKVQMKFVPELRFEIDRSVDEGMHISELIRHDYMHGGEDEAE